MDEKEDILKGNFAEYFSSATEAFAKKRFNTATTLFFKAIAAATDIFILKKEGFVPSSHTQRFRILEQKHPDIYKILDRDFPFYQDSYTKKMDEEAAKLLMEDAEAIDKIIKG
ncbi:hypothetical protein JW968_03870 [Candidatus Woesearchaeota archaeon]|nr:hypothetical protein [Candidatus Woesearchaeota archaeon]